MAWPIVTKTSGGLAVTVAANGLGIPYEEATNGFGTAVTFVASGGLPVVLGGASNPPAQVPAAPVLTWNSASSDTTPDFLVDLPNGWGDYRDAVAGDHLKVEYQLQSGGAWTSYIDHTLTSGDITDDLIAVTGVGALSSGDYYFRGRIERGVLISANSANVAVTIAAATNRLMWGSDQQLWSTDHLTWA